MRTSVDSELYISGAENMINGEFPKGREIFYSSYIFTLAILSILSIEPEYVVYVHFLVAIIAMISTYQFAYRLTENNLIAIIAPILYILWFKFQQWNMIIYTDAMFSHMVIISINLLVKSRGFKEKGIAIALILFTSFLRPTGIGLLLSALIYLVYLITEKRKFKLYQKLISLVLFSSFFIYFINYVLDYFIDSFIDSYNMAEIIYPKIKILVDEPSLLYIPDITHQPVVRLFLFIITNPIYFIKISTIKGLLYIGHIKPYYSYIHNFFIAGFLYPAYFLAIKGYLSIKQSSLKLLILSFLVFQLLTVCLTSENWDGRFLLPILPLIFILSSLGVYSYGYSEPPTRNNLNR